MNIIFGSVLLGAAASRIPYIMGAMVSAKEIYATIERVRSVFGIEFEYWVNFGFVVYSVM